MGFNKRKMEDQRRQVAEKEAARVSLTKCARSIGGGCLGSRLNAARPAVACRAFYFSDNLRSTFCLALGIQQ